MKARKRILATLLSVAVAATTVLPGAVAANAATIVTETPEQEIEKNTWTETMDRVNTGGTQIPTMTTVPIMRQW